MWIRNFFSSDSYYFIRVLPVTQQRRSDDQLMLMVQETGDHAAFAALVRRYQKPLFGYLYRCTGDRYAAEDLFQETFMRIYQARAAFNRKLSFSAWAYRIATNAFLDMRKKKAVAMEKPAGDDVFSQYASGHDGPDKALLKKAKSQRVQELLSGLPDRYRTVLLLVHYQGLSLKDVAAALGIPVGTVKSRLHKAFRQLAALAEKRGLIDEM